ncbi:MAG: isocitrate lyase/phosphoenolpyruvate mutase family protein [Nitrospinota bacterium]|nr:isocitrate lyase/phosphoenolpyruvate mutase family protein [Nitrospinota bacterium]
MGIIAREKFQSLISKSGITVIPGAFNALTAKLIERKGFESVYLSGAGVINSLAALPDNSLVTETEMLTMARYITSILSIPLIVDVDTGFGNSVNVVRTVRDFENAGVACIQIEDQTFPKRCGHLDGKEVLDRSEFIQKIRAAIENRNDPQLSIMARIDSRSTLGLDEAIIRGNESFNAGADIVFIEALHTREEFSVFASNCEGPLLANMTEFGKTPHITKNEFLEMGYRFVIFPVSIMRAMMKAGASLLDDLASEGTLAGSVEKMMTRKELYQLIDYDDYHEIEKKYLNKK